MMIADLIDQVDVFDKFNAFGAPVLETDSTEMLCRKMSSWLEDQDEEINQKFLLLIEAWSHQKELILPEVSVALEIFPNYKARK